MKNNPVTITFTPLAVLLVRMIGNGGQQARLAKTVWYGLHSVGARRLLVKTTRHE
jgi:hypothetical protein